MTGPRFPRLVLLAASSLAVSASVGHAERLPPALCSGSLFGPETFHPRRSFITNLDTDLNALEAPKRGVTPTGTRRMISLQGHTPPFVLRAKNGDGGSRVSAAWVWLDGQEVLGPDEFSLSIPEHERVVAVGEGSVLRVELVGTPDSSLTVEIRGGRPDTEQIVLTPDGGHYELKSGAVLDVPPGAVDQETRIAVCGVSASSVQPRLDANVAEPTALAVGIQGVPSGLAFNLPVTITAPAVPRRSPDDVPVAFVMEPEGGAFSLAPTDLEHDPTNDLIRARVSHFTELVWVYANDEALTKGYDCRDRANWCRCYGLREVIETSSDSMIGDECYEASSDLLVTLLECSGQPQESHTVRAKEIPRIRIDGPNKLPMCEPGLQFEAVGIHASEPRERPVLDLTWHSDRPDIASVDPSGFVTPHADGCTATWSRPGEVPCLTSIWACGSCGAMQAVGVEVVGPYELDPLATPPTLVKGGEHTLTTVARDKDGAPLDCEPIDWESSDEDVVTVLEGVLTAQGPGDAVITARARHKSRAEERVSVKVRSNDECDSVPCTLMVGVAVQPPVQRCSGTADACVYTGDGGLQLSAWMRNDSTGQKVKRELAWAAVSVTGSVELAPATDPDPAVTRVQVKGFVPGMVTMQAFDPSSALSVTLKIHVVPWLFQATASGSGAGESHYGPPYPTGMCSVSDSFSGLLTVRLSGPWDPTHSFGYTHLGGSRTSTGLSCPFPGTVAYNPSFWLRSSLTATGSTVSEHWAGPFSTTCSGTQDFVGTFDDEGMTGTLTEVHNCNWSPGESGWWTESLPFYLTAVAVKP